MSLDKYIVVDTSVLISALLKPNSVPAQALEYARKHFKLAVSTETLTELTKVLSRDYLTRYRTIEERETFLVLYSELAELIPFTEQTEHVTDCRDAKDNKFLDLAIAANARILVSSDSDLLVLHPYRGIYIVTPSLFLQMAAH
jgi:putative PIN family toxin of toxin-antitoxin system